MEPQNIAPQTPQNNSEPAGQPASPQFNQPPASQQAPTSFQPQPQSGQSQPPAQSEPQVMQAPAPPQPAQPQFGQAPTPPQPTTPLGAEDDQSYTSNPFTSSLKGLGKVLSVNPLTSVTVTLLFYFLMFGGALLISILSIFLMDAPAVSLIINLVFWIAMILLGIRVYAATIVLYMKSYRKETVNARQALGKEASGRLTALVVTSIMAGILILLGFIALIIPGLILLARFSLFGFVVYEERLGYITALKRSWKLTSGHTFEMLSVIIAQVFIVGGYGLLSQTATSAGLANRYYELRAAEESGMPTGKTHWLNFLLPLVPVVLIGLFFALNVFMYNQMGTGGYDSFDSSNDFDSFEYESNFPSSTGDDYYYDYNYQTQ